MRRVLTKLVNLAVTGVLSVLFVLVICAVTEFAFPQTWARWESLCWWQQGVLISVVMTWAAAIRWAGDLADAIVEGLGWVDGDDGLDDEEPLP